MYTWILLKDLEAILLNALSVMNSVHYVLNCIRLRKYTGVEKRITLKVNIATL